MSNPNIRCSVRNCKFNDKNYCCNLESITVGTDIGATSKTVATNHQTECVSFMCE